MKRREALKTLGFAAAGLVALPAWARGWSAENVILSSSIFTQQERALLSSVADTFIPEKDGIGAVPLEVDKFLVRLFDECYEEDVRNNIKFQLGELNRKATNLKGKTFPECTQNERENLLLSFQESDINAEEQFFRLVKFETVRGFRTSEVVMEKYHGYRVAPGRYNGNADVEG